MGKKKRMVLLVLGIIILGIAIYQYPLQKAFAQKAFGTYIDKQGLEFFCCRVGQITLAIPRHSLFGILA